MNKAEVIMTKIAKKADKPEAGYWATQMAGTRAMRRSDTGASQAIASNELIGKRMTGGLKGAVKGLAGGAAAGAGAGIVASILSKGKYKPGNAAAGGAAAAGVIGTIGGNIHGQYQADKEYLADRGITMKAMGFKKPELSPAAKKKYLSSKYQGGGFDVNNKV